jgi:biotin transport system permease protein
MYQSGTGLAYHCPPRIKLLLLIIIGTCSLIVHSCPLLIAGQLVVVLLFCQARIPIRTLTSLLPGLLLLLVTVASCQWFFNSPMVAAVATLRLSLALSAAWLFTLTTSLTALLASLDWILKPLQRLGLATDRLSILIAMTIRFIPMISLEIYRVRQAQSARGARSIFHLLPSLMVRMIRLSDALGETLTCRVN